MGFFKQLLRNKLALMGGIVVVILFAVSFLAPIISPYNPDTINVK